MYHSLYVLAVSYIPHIQVSVQYRDREQEKVLSVLEQFIGTYEQIPPMYSAIKVGGKKLYELAREGKEIERTPRKVNIQNIEIIQISEKPTTLISSFISGFPFKSFFFATSKTI